MFTNQIKDANREADLENGETIDKIILKPYYHLENFGEIAKGKYTTMVFNSWLKVPEKKFQEIAEIITIVENGLVIYDDIIDGTPMRRGKPSSHVIYGVPRTITAVNIILTEVLQKVLKLGHPRAAEIYLENFLEILKGEATILHWRETGICPTEEEYFEEDSRRIGGFFKICLDLLQIFSENKSDFAKIMRQILQLGRLFNDYINLKCSEYQEFKGFGCDITEGNYTIPIIYAIRNNATDVDTLINILKERTTDKEKILRAIEIIENSGAFEYMRKRMKEVREEMMEEMKHLGDNPYLLKWLLVEYYYY